MNEILSAKEIQYEKILQALTTSKDINEASKMAGVSRKIIYSYMNDCEFVIAYRNIERQQMRDICNNMTQGAIKACDFLLKILDNENATLPLKLNASVKFLDLFCKFRELEGNINACVFEENNISMFENYNEL